MWQPNDNNSPSSHQENEEKQQSSSSQKDESSEDRLLTFQRYYIDDYIADKEGRLEEDEEDEEDDEQYKWLDIDIHFNFQESSSIPNIYIPQPLHLYNPQQLESILRHYYNQSNVFHSITYHPKYKDLQEEIERRKTSQSNIDKKIDELFKYLTFTLQDSGYGNYILTYTNLNRSTLLLAISHLQSILLVFKTWSYRDSDRNEVDGLMIEISKQYNDRLPYKPFWNHYTDSLLYTQLESPLITLRINLNFKEWDNNTKHSLNRNLSIRNIEQFKAVLRFYDSDTRQYFIPFKPSLKHKDIDPDITYRNTLQVRIDEVLKFLEELYFKIEEDEYDPLTLNLNYDSRPRDLSIPLIIKHLELTTLTFKTWNDDENDKDAMDLYLSELKDKLLSIFKDELFDSSWDYYKPYFWAFWNTTTLHLNLHIILKTYQHTITKTLQLKESKWFIRLLYYHTYLSNGYLPFSKSFDTSLSNILYIFDQDENDPSILNLYYYPIPNELDTSLIIKHLELMLSSFKILNQEVNDININPIDIKTFSHYLSSITGELNLLSINKELSPTKPFQHHFITQYQDKLAKPLPTTNLNLHLRLLLKDSHPISNTYPLNLSSTNQLLSLLNHYSLSKDPLDPSWIEAYKDNKDLYQEITYRSRLQTSYDRVLSKLSKRVSFRVEEDPKDPSKLGIDYINLTGSDVPYAVKHLDTMMMVYKAWNTSYKDKLEVDNFVFLMREDVEEWFTSDKSIPSNIRDDNPLNNALDNLGSKLDDMLASVNSLRWGTYGEKDEEKDDDKVSLPKDVSAVDDRLGGASRDIPNLLEVTGGDISMMEDLD